MYPFSVDVDGAHKIYVADTYHDQIQVFDSTGNFISKFGNAGSENGQLNKPYGLTLNGNGSIYIADTINNRIQSLNTDGTYNWKIANNTSAEGSFNLPYSLDINSEGDLYVVDRDNDRIQVFSNNGDYKFTFGTEGSDNGQFIRPYGIAIDDNDKVYVTDLDRDDIQIFNSNGEFIKKFGSNGSGDGQFNSAYGIDIDSQGNIFISDIALSRVQMFDSNTDFVTSFGSYGTGDGKFREPLGVVVDNHGKVYIADSYNDRIQVLEYDETSLSFSYKFGSYGKGEENLDTPYLIDISGDNIYIADNKNYRVQVFSLIGEHKYSFGSYGTALGQLNIPYDVKVYDGKIFVVEKTNNRVQVFEFDKQPPEIKDKVQIFNDNTPSLSGTIKDNLTSITSIKYRIDSSTTWSNCEAKDEDLDELTEEYLCNVSTILNEGSHTVTLQFTDNRTNTGEGAYSFIVDTIKPTIRITNLGLISNIPDKSMLYYYFTSQTPHIKGNSEPGSIVHFKYENKDYTTTTNTKGIFEITIPELPRKLVELKYYSQDKAGNKSNSRLLKLTVGNENFPIDIIPDDPDNSKDTSDTSLSEEFTSEIKPIIYKYEIIGEEEDSMPNASVIIDGQEYISDKDGYIYVEVKLEENLQAEIQKGAELLEGYVQGEKIIIGSINKAVDYEIEETDNKTAESEIKNNTWYIWLLIIIIVMIIGYYSWNAKIKKK